MTYQSVWETRSVQGRRPYPTTRRNEILLHHIKRWMNTAVFAESLNTPRGQKHEQGNILFERLLTCSKKRNKKLLLHQRNPFARLLLAASHYTRQIDAISNLKQRFCRVPRWLYRLDDNFPHWTISRLSGEERTGLLHHNHFWVTRSTSTTPPYYLVFTCTSREKIHVSHLMFAIPTWLQESKLATIYFNQLQSFLTVSPMFCPEHH